MNAARLAIGAAPRSLLPLATLVAGGICLGAAPVVVKAVDLAPEVSAFWRVLLAAPCFALLALMTPTPRRRAARESAETGDHVPLWLLGLAAVLFAADLVVMHIAIAMTDVAVATLLTNCAPFFVGLMGLVGLTDRPTRAFWVALPVALVGIALLIGVNVTGGGSAAGDALALVASALYAGYLVCVRELRARGASTLRIMVVVTAGSAALLALLFVRAGAPVPTDVETWLLLAALVFVGQLAGQGLVAVALKELPVALGSLVLLLQPVAAGVLSWALLGEILAPVQIVGIAIVLFAIGYAGSRPREAHPLPSAPGPVEHEDGRARG